MIETSTKEQDRTYLKTACMAASIVRREQRVNGSAPMLRCRPLWRNQCWSIGADKHTSSQYNL